MTLARCIWLLLFSFLLALLVGCACLLTVSYDTIIQFAVDQLQRADLQPVLENKYFTLEKYQDVKRAGYVIVPILFGLLGLVLFLRKKIIGFIQALLSSASNSIRSMAHAIKNTAPSIKILLVLTLLLVLVRSIYYAYTVYPQYDECWNYNYFLSNNIFTTFFAYNNYPLHNIITYGFLSVLPDNTFCMRLPNILIGLATLTLVFVFIKKTFRSEALALVAVALFSVLPMVFFYFLFARGVMLALFFAFLVSYYFFIKNITTWRKTDVVFLLIFGSLGCYAMISFPLFLVSIYSVFFIKYSLKKNIPALSILLLAGLGTALLTLFFYTPILLGSGVHIALESGYVQGSRSLAAFIQAAQYISLDQIGFQFGVYVFLAINLFLYFVSPQRILPVLNSVLLLLPYFIFISFGTFLPARALGFQVLAYLFTICHLLFYLQQNKYIFTSAALVLILMFSTISAHHSFFTWSIRKDKGAYILAQKLIKKDIKQLYDQVGNFSYFVPSIQYHYKIQHKEITYFTNNKKSVRYLPQAQYQGRVWAADFLKISEENKKSVFHIYQDESNHFGLYELAPAAPVKE